MIIVALIVFFCLQAFVLFCCLAAGNDPGSQEISDQEQMASRYKHIIYLVITEQQHLFLSHQHLLVIHGKSLQPDHLLNGNQL